MSGDLGRPYHWWTRSVGAPHPPTSTYSGSSASASRNRNWPDAADREIALFEERQRWDEQQETSQEASTPEQPQEGKILVLLVSLVLGELWYFAQFAAVVILLVISGVKKSPTMPGLTEWSACDRPLGAWNALWLANVVMNAWLSWWHTQTHRMRQQGHDDSDTELSTRRVLNRQRHYAPPGNAGVRAGPRRQHYRQTSGLSYEGGIGYNGNGQDPPGSPLFKRLSLFTPLLTLAWFLTAHVLEYTSVDTCRLSSPHLWWLTFAILCTPYLMVLKKFLLELLAFIYVICYFLLLCQGRHSVQNIKPDIDKLPKSVVDRIPLVLYIPPSPGKTAPARVLRSPAPLPTPKGRFRFFTCKDARNKKKQNPPAAEDPPVESLHPKAIYDKESEELKEAGAAAKGQGEGDVPWDEMREMNEYPLIQLERNRAVCAICLMDFEADEAAGASGREGQGEGPEPLRLLTCGHAFHRMCLDPWLTNVSGRCPNCQRPVEVTL